MGDEVESGPMEKGHPSFLGKVSPTPSSSVLHIVVWLPFFLLPRLTSGPREQGLRVHPQYVGRGLKQTSVNGCSVPVHEQSLTVECETGSRMNILVKCEPTLHVVYFLFFNVC